jgi:hypothetical protein
MEMTRIDTFFGVTKKPKKLQKKTPFNHLPAYTFTFANVSTVVQVTKRTHDGLLFFHRHFRLFKFAQFCVSTEKPVFNRAFVTIKVQHLPPKNINFGLSNSPMIRLSLARCCCCTELCFYPIFTKKSKSSV